MAKQGEKDFLILDVFPEDEHTDIGRLEELIHDVKIPGVTWAEKFKVEDVAYGVKKLRVGCIVADDKVPVESIIEEIERVHDYGQNAGHGHKDHSAKNHENGHHGHGHSAVEAKKMVQNAEFVAFSKSF